MRELIRRFRAWQNRRYWQAHQMEHLRLMLQEDGRWMAHNPIAATLTDRYLAATAEDWYQQVFVHSGHLREQLGLDPHAEREHARVQTASAYCAGHAGPLSVVGLGERDALSAADVDQPVAVAAAQAEEKASPLIDLGRDGSKHHLQPAGLALPHEGSPSSASDADTQPLPRDEPALSACEAVSEVMRDKAPERPPSAYVHGASIHASDMPGTVVRKLDAAFHEAARSRHTEALAAAPQPADLVNDSFAADWLTNRAALHPETIRLVVRFARALAEKLAAAERKYGYSDGWRSPDWMDECRAKLMEHIAKGDPRDVAAYCAFLWHHGTSTAAPQPAPAEQLPDPLGCRACTHPDCGRFDGSQSVECAAMAFNACARPDRTEAIRQDAARYAYLRSRPLDTIKQGGVFAGLVPDNVVLNGDSLDAAVDAALHAQSKEGGAAC
ncbi:hypothetical protein [Pseudacidovorax sp. NFM-22]|uniref:hypothetical protein n=1 Tax=Pseudacidovorax sp. NFM-22 TaxID=2744469 RepID=UPI001F3143E9|nr:hypothetical protein [Pseudacidovorax sp. NFM-22]